MDEQRKVDKRTDIEIAEDQNIPVEMLLRMLLERSNGNYELLSRKLMEMYVMMRIQRNRWIEQYDLLAKDAHKLIPPLNKGEVVVIKTRRVTDVKKALSRTVRDRRPLYIIVREDDQVWITNKEHILVKHDRSKVVPPAPVGVTS